MELSLDDFDQISRKTPVIADLRPWGTYTAWELYEAGGTALVFKRLLEAGLLFGEEKTLTGRTLAEEVERAYREQEGQKVVFPVEKALKPHGGSWCSRETSPLKAPSSSSRGRSAPTLRARPGSLTRRRRPWRRS